MYSYLLPPPPPPPPPSSISDLGNSRHVGDGNGLIASAINRYPSLERSDCVQPPLSSAQLLSTFHGGPSITGYFSMYAPWRNVGSLCCACESSPLQHIFLPAPEIAAIFAFPPPPPPPPPPSSNLDDKGTPHALRLRRSSCCAIDLDADSTGPSKRCSVLNGDASVRESGVAWRSPTSGILEQTSEIQPNENLKSDVSAPGLVRPVSSVFCGSSSQHRPPLFGSHLLVETPIRDNQQAASIKRANREAGISISSFVTENSNAFNFVEAPLQPEKSSVTTKGNLCSAGYMTSPAASPAPRDNKHDWYQLHEKFVELARYSQSQVCLIGDSIINGLTRYREVWNQYFKCFDALNFGIGGDRTQHVLWRAENGEVPCKCKYVIVHCGTNNIDRNKPHEIANGVASVGLAFRSVLPHVKVFLAGLLPRDLKWSARREKILLTNRHLKDLCMLQEMKNFYFVEPDESFCLKDGNLNETMYYHDYLHLNEQGNQAFAISLHSALLQVIGGDTATVSSTRILEGTVDVRTHTGSLSRKRSFELGESIVSKRSRTEQKDNAVAINVAVRRASAFPAIHSGVDCGKTSSLYETPIRAKPQTHFFGAAQDFLPSTSVCNHPSPGSNVLDYSPDRSSRISDLNTSLNSIAECYDSDEAGSID